MPMDEAGFNAAGLCGLHYSAVIIRVTTKKDGETWVRTSEH